MRVIDDFSREFLAGVVDNPIAGERVARELDAIGKICGYALMVVSDNATEHGSKAMRKWQQGRGVEWHYIAAGKPMQNGHMESFTGRLKEVSQRAPIPHPSPKRCSIPLLKPPALSCKNRSVGVLLR